MNNDFCLYKVTSCDFIVHALEEKKKKNPLKLKCAIQTGT